MEPSKISIIGAGETMPSPAAKSRKGIGEDDFQAYLSANPDPCIFPLEGKAPIFPSETPPVPEAQPAGPSSVSREKAAALYKAQGYKAGEAGGMSAIQKYKDDQLLLHPGGDHYYLDQKKVIPEPEEQKSFWGRVGKDISDAFDNVKNFFKDFLFGAKIHYRDEQGQIQEGSRTGLVGSLVDFCKDLGSAFSFGSWRPDGEKEPQGGLQRAGFFLSKLKEAICGDLLQGTCGSAVHMGKDLLLAGWNALEAIPDATIGNLKEGQKMTTEVFDDGQVVLDYLTDIVPFGDAWVRVHSVDLLKLKAPLLQNIQQDEHHNDDPRWRYVRNTPFRKVIETAGSLIMDFLTLKVLGRVDFFSDERKGGS